MTKRDAALQALALARAIHGALAGDEGADEWILRLVWLAEGLDESVRRHPWYDELVLSDAVARTVKLRRLIDHPATPQPERDAALRALARL